jgi:hypothetical protein
MDAILRYLTQSCQHHADVVNHEAKLVDPIGELVKLSVEPWDVGRNSSSLKITITTRQTTLAASVREAISRQLQVLLIHS